ncbi:MAG: hypothetical protein DMF71_02335 [Acidobacteria bacterium]|nr:MAG: hypothetical protein DMF71_02335 [Acidobacteriota bacterium]
MDGVIFAGLIILIGLTAVPYGTVEPWSEAVFECAVLALAGLWVIHGLLTGGWRVEIPRIFLPLIALVGLALIQSLSFGHTVVAGVSVGRAISADPFESRLFALKLSSLILAGLLLLRFISTRRRLRVIVYVIIAVAVASALFGIARQTAQHGPGFFLPALRPAIGYAQFINKNHFAFLMEMAMGLVMGVAFVPENNKERLPFFLSALLVIWAALVLSFSRGGLLAMVAQIVCAAFLLLNAKAAGRALEDSRGKILTVARIGIAGALLLAVAGGVVWLGGDQIATGVETVSTEIALSDRTELHEGARRRDIWRASWGMFKAHPLAGTGFGGYWAEVPTFHEASGAVTPQQAHNDYLEILASGGIAGLALLVWFAIALVRQARASLSVSRGFQRAATLGAILSVIGVGVHSVFDFGLHITVNALIFVVLLAILSLRPLPSGNI